MSAVVILVASILAAPGTLDLPPGIWVKLSPVEGSQVSPRLGYEGACAWDGSRGLFLRYGGHNQGGGGEQHSEVWSFDPLTTRWKLHETDVSPPGVCCAQQNLLDPVARRYIRFPSFSGSHGWQWWREIYLNDVSVWTFDPDEDVWRARSPLPTASPRPLRCAAWDSHHDVAVIFGGETSQEGTLVYDPWTNVWTWMRPPAEPEFRSGGNMAYDEARRLHILFGSQFDDDPHTWGYDLARNEWRDLRPPDMPPTKENDAVLAYDSLRQKIVAIVKVTKGQDDDATHRLETWVYDAGANRWSPLHPAREPDPTGNRARVLVFAPELDAFLLENRTHPPHGPAEQQIWALRLSAPLPGGQPPAVSSAPGGPLAPAGVTVRTTGDGAVVSWKAPPAGGVEGYVILRGTGPQPWRTALERVAEVGPGALRHDDLGLARGTVYHYAIEARRGGGAPGAVSRRVRAQPGIVEDVVVSVLGSRHAEVSWKPSPSPDVAGYHVERASVEVLSEDQLRRLKKATPPLDPPSVGAVTRIGPFERRTREPIRDLLFVDTAVDLSRPSPIVGTPVLDRPLHEEHLDPAGKAYSRAVHAYRVVAVSALGVESGPSPAVLTVPSPPRRLFSKEDGTACRLRWAPGAEKGIAGYRVYRMDGRWDGDPITRLTRDPLAATSFVDPGAGKEARRYYVVAVDALGQEGLPSAPVWFDREWKQFYEPFVGEWHQ